MTRYFYDDPLAALWMEKHHGMQFEPSAKPGGPFYIHPDSLALLEPQVGDLVTNTHIENNLSRPASGIISYFINYGKNAMISTSERHNGKRHFCESIESLKIIQRNGIAFIYPKMEE